MLNSYERFGHLTDVCYVWAQNELTHRQIAPPYINKELIIRSTCWHVIAFQHENLISNTLYIFSHI